jgi:cytochrome c-type biogenesis protein CcmF
VLYKDVPVAMGEYFAIFRGDSISETDPRLFYRVDYERRDTNTNEVLERFTLYPDLIKPKNSENFTANPSSKHYLHKDIFTYVNQASNSKMKDVYSKSKVHAGDTIFLTGGFMIFKGFKPNAGNEKYQPQQGDISVAAQLSIHNLKGKVKDIEPVYYIRDQMEHYVEDTFTTMDLYTRFSKIIPEENAAEIEVKQDTPDYIVLKAIVFPYINLVWLGVIIMVLGFFLSLLYRYGQREIRVDIPSVEN